MKKLLAIAAMMMVCVCASAQKVVSVQDAANMSSKELKKAANEQKAREKLQKEFDKVKVNVVKAEKKVQSCQKVAQKAADKVKDAQKAADKAAEKLKDAEKDLEKAQKKQEDLGKQVAKQTGLPLAEED